MKKLVILFVIACSINQVFSQNSPNLPFYDAISLNKFIKDGVFLRDKDSEKDTIENIASILIKYLNEYPGLNIKKL